ncbi:metallophosphoesterase [bacterium]|nr:metallophosphoesterase [bacterium]
MIFKYISLLLSGLLLYCFGLYSGTYKLFPYNEVRNLRGILSLQLHTSINSLRVSEDLDKFQVCRIPEIKKIPFGSTAFIGHAYGSPAMATTEGFLSENVSRFLNENKINLSSVVFTGDVFSFPSKKKWDNLHEKFPQMKIHIAPGNHDIWRPDSKEAFENSKIYSDEFPYLINNIIPIIVDDSVISMGPITNLTQEKINSFPSRNLIVARHHVPIIELITLANSNAGFENLPKFSEFQKKFETDGNITWIIGDSGAHQKLPRIFCARSKNHTFITNGVGGLTGDRIIILNKGMIFQFLLD